MKKSLQTLSLGLIIFCSNPAFTAALPGVDTREEIFFVGHPASRPIPVHARPVCLSSIEAQQEAFEDFTNGPFKEAVEVFLQTCLELCQVEELEIIAMCKCRAKRLRTKDQAEKREHFKNSMMVYLLGNAERICAGKILNREAILDAINLDLG